MNKYLSCVESKILEPTLFYGRFVLGYFSSGEALTVVNTLRRTLLGQVSGIAIACVHIRGANNEYQSLVGVKESIFDILLNFKQLTFCGPESFEPQILFLNVRGPGIVKAKHLKLPYFLRCVNPEHYIATLNENGYVQMKLLVRNGTGYLSLEPNSKLHHQNVQLLQRDQNNIQDQGYFPVDGIFSPIIKVNYSIESAAHSEIAFLEVWTNGSIDPSQAIFRATRKIIHLFLPWQVSPYQKNLFLTKEKDDLGEQKDISYHQSEIEMMQDVSQEFHTLVLEHNTKFNRYSSPNHASTNYFDIDPIFASLPPPNSDRLQAQARARARAKARAKVQHQVPALSQENFLHENVVMSVFLSEQLQLRRHVYTSSLGALTSYSLAKRLTMPNYKKAVSQKDIKNLKISQFGLQLKHTLPVKKSGLKSQSAYSESYNLATILTPLNVQKFKVSLDIDILNVHFDHDLYVLLKMCHIETVTQLLYYRPEELFLMSFTMQQIERIRYQLTLFLNVQLDPD